MSKLNNNEELARRRQDLLDRAGLLGISAIKDLLSKYILESRDLNYIERQIKRLEDERDVMNKGNE